MENRIFTVIDEQKVYLPWEVSQKILLMLDGRSLHQARQVCQGWNEAIMDLVWGEDRVAVERKLENHWRFSQPRKIERTLKLDGFRGYLLTYSEHRAVMMFTSEPIKQDESFEEKERLDDDDDQENDQEEENQVKIDEPVSTEYSGESRTPVILSLFNLLPLQVRPQLPTAANIPGQMVTDGVDMTEPIAEHVAQQMEESGGKNLVSDTKESLEMPKDGEERQKMC